MADDRQRQRAIRIKISDLIDLHCKGCSVYSANQKLHGQAQAQEKCGSDCSIGKQLKSLGRLLLSGRPAKAVQEDIITQVKPKKVNPEVADEGLTKEKYLELSNTLPDYKIANQFNIASQTLKRRKAAWGLTKKRNTNKKDSNKNKGKATQKLSKSMAIHESEEIQKNKVSIKTEELDVISERITQMQKQLQEKTEEAATLKEENEKLQKLFDQQTKSSGYTGENVLSMFLQGSIHFSITTRNQDAADLARRTLQNLGIDLDYRVRNGVIEVTTENG